MSFAASADAYSRFMGRYSEPLSGPFAAFAGIHAGDRVVDVGSGPGALTAHLLTIGAEVAAIDPSPPFAAALRRRFADVDVREGTAEAMPFATGEFDAALAQLVVHFMPDPVAGIKSMARVTRSGGRVAACIWDAESGAVAPFWEAVRQLDADAVDPAFAPGAHRGSLSTLFAQAGLDDIEEIDVTVGVLHPSFEEWWEPYTFGIGPAGAYCARLDAADRDRVRSAARDLFGEGPFTVTATAWAARGTVNRP
ncbi:MAG: class I SAM-dependent methyltransferase [Gordonia sp. (in: high G+C Gram-positive bacteria)]|uniref:class I SAM-dependent methyltransferase n=1 Tax=Gordonia TaxID=2053 RepID=UPI003263A26A